MTNSQSAKNMSPVKRKLPLIRKKAPFSNNCGNYSQRYIDAHSIMNDTGAKCKHIATYFEIIHSIGLNDFFYLDS